VGGRERDIRSPHDAHALGIGMVYQHFTLVPSMTVAENLVMARDDVPAVVRWPQGVGATHRLHGHVPSGSSSTARSRGSPPAKSRRSRSLKQLYLRRRFMVLDEPTSVLTPAEAGRGAGHAAGDGAAGEVTVLMITHKLAR